MSDSATPPDAYLADLTEKVALSTELYTLSYQEFDKQVVYLAGGGLALTLTFAPDLVALTSSFLVVASLMLTWFLFAAALLINLFSHRRAAETHDAARSLHHHYRACYQAQRPINETQCATWNTRMKSGDARVRTLNSWSFYTVAAGIASFILFVFLNLLIMPKNQPATPPSSYSTKPAPPPDSIRGIPAPASLLTTPPPPTPTAPPAPTAAPTPDTSSTK